MPNVAEIAAMLFDKVAAFQSRRTGAIFAKLWADETTIRLIITIFPLLCLSAAGPKAQAVVPPPDGGYPNFTTAEGQDALFSLTTGAANTAVGRRSLFSNSMGSFNTTTGAGALLFNTADDNTAVGAAALLFNTTGVDNTAVGAAALSNNTMGSDNTATGAFALLLNTTGDFNTATGSDALFSNTTGQFNTADGLGALDFNTVGNSNTAIGTSALQGNTEGDNNTGVGNLALSANTTGNRNTVLGANAGGNITSADNVICIGANLDGDNVSDSCFINNIFTATSVNGIGVLVNGNGKLGTTTSSRRFKEEIKPMDQLSEALFALKPVSFHYKKEIDPTGTPQLGLVAEEVEKVNSDLVVRDKEGKPYSVRYDQVNAMLLNEFLKEHRKVQKLEAALKAVTEQLNEQAAQIQKVSGQIEMGKSATRFAATSK
jgi:Chaperone of endosialidase